MADTSAVSLGIGELAERLGAVIEGGRDREDTVIEGIAALDRAGPRQASFLSSDEFRNKLSSSRAAAVLVRAADAPAVPGIALVVDDPYRSYARLSRMFDRRPGWTPGISSRAEVAENASVDATAFIGANAVIAAGARVGARVHMGAGCHLGEGASVGEDSYLYPGVTIYHETQIGARAIIHSGAVIGSDGFGFAPTEQGYEKIAQVGRVVIGDDVEIGANCTIDRGALNDTVLADGVKLDNMVHLAHNVVVGEHTALAANVTVAGSTVIGARCGLSGLVAVKDHIQIADGVTVTGTTFVINSIRKPGMYSGAMPMMKHSSWLKNVAIVRRLEALVKRVAKLEAGQRDR